MYGPKLLVIGHYNIIMMIRRRIGYWHIFISWNSHIIIPVLLQIRWMHMCAWCCLWCCHVISTWSGWPGFYLGFWVLERGKLYRALPLGWGARGILLTNNLGDFSLPEIDSDAIWEVKSCPELKKFTFDNLVIYYYFFLGGGEGWSVWGEGGGGETVPPSPPLRLNPDGNMESCND